MFDTKDSIGPELRALRVRAGLKITPVAKAARMPLDRLSRIERGLAKETRVYMLSRILDAMGMELTVKPKFHPPEPDD